MKRCGAMAAGMLVMGLTGCTPTGVIQNLPDPNVARERARLVEAPLPPPRIAVPTPLRGRTIVIDPGHGGHDPGALGVGPAPEEIVNLGISLRLIQLLEDRGADVVATRTSDRFIELDDRAALAEDSDADLFVSIHADSCPRAEVSGATVYIARGAGGASIRAGGRIASALESAGVPCRGVRNAGFRVLVAHSRPAVLIECGYLTNPWEARLLSTAEYQARLAAAIADGITAHLQE